VSALTPPERRTLTKLLRKMLEHRPEVRMGQATDHLAG
jgi:hypothetical protein